MIERGVLEAIAELGGGGEEFLVATVVRVTGSAYRRPGARMVATRDRWVAGGVSAGCLEGDVLAKAWWWLGDGDARVVAFEQAADPEDGAVGSGCGGKIEVLIERGARAADALGTIATCDRLQARGGIATAIDGPFAGSRACVERGYVTTAMHGARDADAGRARVRESGAADARRTMMRAMVRAAEDARDGDTTHVVTVCGCGVLVEAIVPRPRLFVLGTHADAVPVARLGRSLGWEVAVVAPTLRPGAHDAFAGIADAMLAPDAARAAIDRSDRAAIVIMSHDYAADRAYLEMALASRARYVGALGPRARTARMLEELGRGGDLRLYAPAGIAVGAETPDEIAISIIAEAQAALAGARIESLRDRTRDRPIHGAPSASAGDLEGDVADLRHSAS